MKVTSMNATSCHSALTMATASGRGHGLTAGPACLRLRHHVTGIMVHGGGYAGTTAQVWAGCPDIQRHFPTAGKHSARLPWWETGRCDVRVSAQLNESPQA